MMNLRKLSVLAITALLVTGLGAVSAIAGTAKAATTTTSLTDLITSLINSVGDDTFSTTDLTTLVNSFTAPTSLLASTSAASSLQYMPMMTTSSSSGTSTTHYGPFASGSPDSGTCGNNWADDTFDRHFTVFQNRDDGSLLVVEQFKDGSFVTTTGSSPGACQNGPPTATVAGGIQGSFHGYEVIPLPAGTTQNSNSPYCDATNPTDLDCTGTIFIETHFTSCLSGTCPVAFSVTTFFFHYVSGDQTLIMNEWKNASADRGGNSGDIRSAN